MQRREGRRDMTHPPDSTISVLVPAGAGHTHFAAKIAAVLGAPKHVLGRIASLVPVAKLY